MLSASNAQQTIDYGYDVVYQLTSEVVNVSGMVTTNGWSYEAAGNLRLVTQGTQQNALATDADNELTAVGYVAGSGSALINSLTVLGTVQPGLASNKWYASTAAAGGQTAPVGTQDGSFAISNVAVTAGANALTVTVEDVTGNVGTQVVNFTVQTVTNGSQVAYDGNGNLSSVTGSSSGNWSYQYDAENRLVNVTSNSVTVLQCWYDGEGHRVAKQEIVGTQTNAVQYIWDGWTLVAVLDGNGQLQEFYTRGVGIAGDVGSLVAVTPYSGGNPSAPYYLHNNHRGDVILARNGTITVATLDYTPYGELRSQSGRYQPRFRFSSKEYDVSTGFYYFPYRYYAPLWARWLSRDPIGERSELNLYRYVYNAPTVLTDTDGLMAKLKKPKTPAVPIAAPLEEKSDCDQWKGDKEEINCLLCCTEVFKNKVPGGSPCKDWPAWEGWYHACMATCMATGGEHGPDIPGPGGLPPVGPPWTPPKNSS
jgi:RHS repeat-associated protein